MRFKSIVLLVLLSAVIAPAWGAVATNGSTVSASNGSTVTSNTFAYTTPTATTTLVITENNTSYSNLAVTPSGITYNGVALTMVPGSSIIESGGFSESSIWTLSSPPTGTSYNVVITYGATITGYAAGATPLTGVNSIGTPTTATGSYMAPSDPAVTAAGGVAGDLYIATTFAGSTVTTTGSSTELWNATPSGFGAAGDSLPGSGSGAFTWTQSATANSWTASAVAFKASAGLGFVPLISNGHPLISNGHPVISQ